MTNGYEFYFADGSDLLTFPITPGELSIKIGSNNKVITLIDEGDINILKSPSLVEFEFEARFPMRQYPYARRYVDFQVYFDKFKQLKEEKKSFRFVIARTTPNGKATWDTDMMVSLESMDIKESADEGDDVLISFQLKQYKQYGIKVLPQSENKNTTSTSEQPRPTENKSAKSTNYKVQSADCLWNIAKAAYGSASDWKKIYEANKAVIEAEAKKHGKESSREGHWIYPGTQLVIPGVDSANLNVQKLW